MQTFCFSVACFACIVSARRLQNSLEHAEDASYERRHRKRLPDNWLAKLRRNKSSREISSRRSFKQRDMLYKSLSASLLALNQPHVGFHMAAFVPSQLSHRHRDNIAMNMNSRPGQQSVPPGSQNARSSRDVVRTVLSRLKLAEAPSQLSWLHVNEVRADEKNTDQDTSPEQMNFLNDELEKCLTRVFPFFDAKARAVAAADQDQKDASGPQLELLLHPPVYTCEQAARMCPKPIMNNGETLAMKNLFLRDKKKRFYLVSACVDTEIKLKEVKFAKQVGFASAEALKEKLNLVAGSVTPFGLLNDGNREATEEDKTDHSVEFHLDPRVVASPDTTVVDFHPNACHATICMRAKDFVEFIEKETGHQVNVLDLE